jgi:hypothetical protein
MSIRVSLLSIVLAIMGASGCATYQHRLETVREDFYSGNLDQAVADIDEGLKKGKAKEADVLKLERSIVDLAAGQPKAAEQTLREVRDHFDHLEQASAAESAMSMLTDAQAKSYAGEDYEKVLIRAFLALSNLMVDGQDAGAYALQVADKQQQIIQAGIDKQGENPKLSYKQVALGPYVNGVLREATHANYDDVQRSCAMVCSWQPDFPYGPQDLERARHGHHSAPGNGVLYVFTLVGHGPHKIETIEVPGTVELLIADRIISAVSKYGLPPTIAPIKVPKVVIEPSMVKNVLVAIDQRPAGTTETITDIGRMAVEQHEAVFSRIMAEAVVRRVVKKGIIYGAEEIIGQQSNSPVNLLLQVAGVAWEATEAADTRCWGLLPEKIQVLRIEVPAGTHQVSLQAGGPWGGIGPAETQTVTVANGRNTYMLANFPETKLVGKILTNQQ